MFATQPAAVGVVATRVIHEHKQIVHRIADLFDLEMQRPFEGTGWDVVILFRARERYREGVIEREPS